MYKSITKVPPKTDLSPRADLEGLKGVFLAVSIKVGFKGTCDGSACKNRPIHFCYPNKLSLMYLKKISLRKSQFSSDACKCTLPETVTIQSIVIRDPLDAFLCHSL